MVYKITGSQENVEKAIEQLSQLLEIVGGPKAPPKHLPAKPDSIPKPAASAENQHNEEKQQSQQVDQSSQSVKEAPKEIESERESETKTGKNLYMHKRYMGLEWWHKKIL